MFCTTGKNGSGDDVTNVNQKYTDSQMSRQMYRQTDRQKDGPPEWSEKLTPSFNYTTV